MHKNELISLPHFCRFMQAIKQIVTCLSCKRCGNVWQPRVEQPVKCPRCGHRFDSENIYNTKNNKKERQKLAATALQASAASNKHPDKNDEVLSEVKVT